MSEPEVYQIVSNFCDLVAVLYPNANSPISAADVNWSVKQLVAENKELREQAAMHLRSVKEGKEGKCDVPGSTTSIVNPASPSVGSRTFNGQWKDHWKVGARIDHRKHGTLFDWLPGKITYVNEATRYRTEDEYNVQLDNGDTVLGVSRSNLRTSKQGEKDDHVLDVILVGSALLCCYVVYKCYSFGKY